MKIGKNRVIERSNLTSRFDNHDYDGDSIIAAAMHSEQARHDFKYAYVRNLVEFEHLDELLIDYEHEAIYSAFMLTYTAVNSEKEDPVVIESMENLPTSILLLEENPGKLYTITEYDETLTYVEWLIHKSIGYQIEKILSSMEIKYNNDKILYRISEDGELHKKGLTQFTEKVWDRIQTINKEHSKEILNFWNIIHEFDKFLLECSGAIVFCSPTFKLEDFVVDDPEIDAFKKDLFTVEPYLAFHINMVLFNKVKEQVEKKPDNILNLVFKSGARLKSVQLLKAASNTGIPTDIYGRAFPDNIKNSLLDGLTPKEYFITGDSARLALAQRQEAIPKGGELQRKFFFTVGILKLDKETYDCKTTKYYEIKVNSKSHLKLLNHRWMLDEETGEEILVNIDDNSLVGKTIKLRSPMTCRNKDYKICKKCFGEKVPESVNLGSTVGAALSEGMIQSVLRTHHFGGAFIATEDKKLMDIMSRAAFKSPDTIISTEDDIDYIKEYLSRIYKEEEHSVVITKVDGRFSIKIEIYQMPFNDDSVKQLNNIVGLIDKNRDKTSLIDPSQLYNELVMVIEQNGILSSYLELIISLLYYDEDGILYRYSDKEPVTQIALKNIIEMLDPKLSIFYNFSNRVISKIYNHKGLGHVDHMYHDLLNIYY